MGHLLVGTIECFLGDLKFGVICPPPPSIFMKYIQTPNYIREHVHAAKVQQKLCDFDFCRPIKVSAGLGDRKNSSPQKLKLHPFLLQSYGLYMGG